MRGTILCGRLRKSIRYPFSVTQVRARLSVSRINFTQFHLSTRKAFFILGHTGETFEGIKTCVELANRYENIYLDISGWGFMNKGYLEYLVKRVDVSKILFGSDFSWIDVRYAAAAVLFAGISEREKRMILSLNASRLFGQFQS